MKGIKVEYLRTVSSPPKFHGLEGEVKFLPVSFAKKLAAAGYVIIVKEEPVARKKRTSRTISVVGGEVE